MKLIKKYAGFLLMLTLLVGFTSCEDDEDIYDDLMGRTWVGDLGFGTNRDPIESGIRLDNNGLGIDYRTLYLDYGYDFALREVRGVRVSGRYMRGDLYLDGEFFGYIELRMQ